MKILLVEDSATLRYAMRNYILEAGHTPLIAQSGEEALQMLETTPVDMIIMDVEMPGLNGFETTRLIREWLAGYWIPIIFVTGRNEDESYREGIDAGGDDYLIKPVSATIIKAKIRALERITEMRDQLNQLNSELEALSQLDSLTQTYNRRTFNELANQQWALAMRQQKCISLLMIDVDHFKLYNDHYGHPAGDQCLKKLTHVFRECLRRPFDLLGRYGGEEFIVLLPDTDSVGAMRVAQAIHQVIEKLALRHEMSSTSHLVTVSIGGATCSRVANHTLEGLIKSADTALYKAKRAGRNRTLIDDVAIHKTVLAVARDVTLIQQMSQILSPSYNVLTSDNSIEAWEICSDIHPDLVIMDHMIADENNEQLCRQITRHFKTSVIPIILVSETDCGLRPVSDASIGIRACVQEPLEAKTLTEAIHKILHA